MMGFALPAVHELPSLLEDDDFEKKLVSMKEESTLRASVEDRHRELAATLQSIEQLGQWRDAEFDQAQKLHADDKLFMAHYKLQDLRRVLFVCEQPPDADKQLQEVSDVKEHGQGVPPLRAKAAQLRTELEHCDLYELVAQRVAETKSLLEQFESDKGWNVIRESGNSTTLYREEPGLHTHSFKVRGKVNAPLLSLMAVLYEVDLYIGWFPMLKRAVELADLSRFHKLVQMEVMCPWPVANRDITCDAYGVNILEQNRVLIFLHSIAEYPGVDIPPETSAVVRAEICLGGFLIEPLTRTTSYVQMMLNSDPKLPYAPPSVLNWFSGKLIHVLLGCMERAAAFKSKYGPVYRERMQTNRAVYEYVQNAIDEYFEKQAKAKAGAAGGDDEKTRSVPPR